MFLSKIISYFFLLFSGLKNQTNKNRSRDEVPNIFNQHNIINYMEPMDVESQNRIGMLRANINERKRNLKNAPDTERRQRCFDIKENSIVVMTIIKNLQTPRFRRHFKEAFNNVSFDAIYYFYRYLELSEQINLDEYLNLCQLIYDYSFKENLDLTICYDFREELLEMDEFSLPINILLTLLNKCIEFIQNSDLRQHNQFQYNNLLGDLHFHIYLLLKDHADYTQNRVDESLDYTIRYYRLAFTQIERRGRIFQRINYLTYFKSFFNERGLSNLYVFNEKYKILIVEFPEIKNS